MSKRKTKRLNAAEEIAAQAKRNLHYLHTKYWTEEDHSNAQRWRRYANEERTEKALVNALTRWLRAAQRCRKTCDRARREMAEMLERAPGDVSVGGD